MIFQNFECLSIDLSLTVSTQFDDFQIVGEMFGMRLEIFVLSQPHASHYVETSLEAGKRFAVPPRVAVAGSQIVEVVRSLQVVLTEHPQTYPQCYFHRIHRFIVVLFF